MLGLGVIIQFIILVDFPVDKGKSSIDPHRTEGGEQGRGIQVICRRRERGSIIRRHERSHQRSSTESEDHEQTGPDRRLDLAVCPSMKAPGDLESLPVRSNLAWSAVDRSTLGLGLTYRSRVEIMHF
jgi:hypothetical protein